MSPPIVAVRHGPARPNRRQASRSVEVSSLTDRRGTSHSAGPVFANSSHVAGTRRHPPPGWSRERREAPPAGGRRLYLPHPAGRRRGRGPVPRPAAHRLLHRLGQPTRTVARRRSRRPGGHRTGPRGPDAGPVRSGSAPRRRADRRARGRGRRHPGERRPGGEARPRVPAVQAAALTIRPGRCSARGVGARERCAPSPVVRSKIEAQEARTAAPWPATTWSSPR